MNKFHKKEKISRIEMTLIALYNANGKEVPVYHLVYDLRNHRFGANIFVLRKMGFDIETIKHGRNKNGQQEVGYILHKSSLPLVSTS